MRGQACSRPCQTPTGSACQCVSVTVCACVHAQVVVGAHFVMRAATDPSSGALTLSAVQLSLVIADVAMPAAGPLVVDTAFSVEWANTSVPDAALQVGTG